MTDPPCHLSAVPVVYITTISVGTNQINMRMFLSILLQTICASSINVRSKLLNGPVTSILCWDGRPLVLTNTCYNITLLKTRLSLTMMLSVPNRSLALISGLSRVNLFARPRPLWSYLLSFQYHLLYLVIIVTSHCVAIFFTWTKPCFFSPHLGISNSSLFITF